MKKLTLCFFLFLGFSLASFGQNETNKSSEKETHHQIGANVGGLINKLLGKDDNFSGAPEVFTFKTGKNNISFRVGFGFDFEKQNDSDGGDGTKQSAFNVRLGFEKLTKVSYRWQYYAGMDLKYAKNNLEFSDDFGLDPNKLQRYSLEPLLGIQFRLTKKLVLQTEASINFFYSKSENPSFIDPFPIFPPQPFFGDKSNKKGVSLTVPNTLYLVLDL